MILRTTALLIGVTLSACRDHRVIQPTVALPRPGDSLPTFELPLRDRGRLASTDFRGRPAVLFLWSTHCPTSRRALAQYRDLHRHYGDRAAIILLSDDASDTELALLPTVLADSGVGGRVALAHGALSRLFDRSKSAPERDTARIEFVLPAYLLIDSNGRVVGRSWGPDAAGIRSTLDSLLISRPAA
jgi:peroxiredoxin